MKLSWVFTPARTNAAVLSTRPDPKISEVVVPDAPSDKVPAPLIVPLNELWRPLKSTVPMPVVIMPVLASVKKTGRILLVSEASERGSFLMTLAANIVRFAFGDLKAPPRVLGSPNWIVPGAEMETTYFPQVDDILDIVTGEFCPEKRSNRRGVRGWDDRELARLAL